MTPCEQFKVEGAKEIEVLGSDGRIGALTQQFAQRTIPYDWGDTGESLYVKAQQAMVSLFREFYPVFRTRKFASIPQKSGIGSFHRSSEIDEASRIELDRMYRGRDLIKVLPRGMLK